MNYNSIPDSPRALSLALSLTLPFDRSLTISAGRTWDIIGQYKKLRQGLLSAASYFRTEESRRVDLITCPPIFTDVARGGSPRTCRRYSFCPFCWARLVAGSCYGRFEQLLFNDSRSTQYGYSRRNEIRDDHVLLEMAEDYWIEGDVREIIWSAHQNLSVHNDRLASLGTFFLTTIEPSAGAWRVRPRLLTVMPKTTFIFPERNNNTVIYKKWDVINRKTIAHAAGRTCEYPVGLLKGPVEKSVAILKARAGGRGNVPRLSVYHGRLRNRTVKNDG